MMQCLAERAFSLLPTAVPHCQQGWFNNVRVKCRGTDLAYTPLVEPIAEPVSKEEPIQAFLNVGERLEAPPISEGIRLRSFFNEDFNHVQYVFGAHDRLIWAG